jgi:Skp family chaperone for outer membrane proteins
MKKIIFVVPLVLSAYLLADAPAKQLYKSNLVIAYVNFQQAFAQEEEVQKRMKVLEEEEIKIAMDEQKARESIEKEVALMNKLTEKARLEKEKALGEKVNSFQKDFTDRRTVLTKKREEAVADLENKNKLLIESLAKRNGIDIILNSAAMVYASENLKKNDMTLELINDFNKAYPVAKETPVKPATKK